ncbi:hypothetical protein [Niallia circulans]|uniref:hypothetical protein n=1 Tax=Niallia circulans TaxID=1397 RepID=UPI00300BAB71
MFNISATFGISWSTAAAVAGIIFWAAQSNASTSVLRAALFGAVGGLLAGVVIMLVGMGAWYLVNKYYTKTKLTSW